MEKGGERVGAAAAVKIGERWCAWRCDGGGVEHLLKEWGTTEKGQFCGLAFAKSHTKILQIASNAKLRFDSDAFMNFVEYHVE